MSIKPKENLNSQISNKILKLKSFSKINLGLWIKEKRPDNYHEIESVFFENENLYDDVTIEFKEDKTLTVKVSFLESELNKLIPTECNHAYRAAVLYFEKTRLKGICNIVIDKKIPLEAGLGGGSSNAACVLKGLNQLFDYKLHENELLLLANQIGSDAPFFILGKTCLGQGRGEILKPVENKLDLEIKTAKLDKISISTKWAYEIIDSREFLTDHRKEIDNLIVAMKEKNYDLLFKNIFNDFEMVIFSKYPELIKLRNKLLSEGYKAVGLCGSGSALYGVREKV